MAGFTLFRNDTRGEGHWVRLKLVGVGMNRDALGARMVLCAGGLSSK